MGTDGFKTPEGNVADLFVPETGGGSLSCLLANILQTQLSAVLKGLQETLPARCYDVF